MIKRSAWVTMPIGLLYLASALKKQGHKVKVVDMEVNSMTKSQLSEFLEQESPDVIGVTSTTPMIKNAFQICRIAKKVNREIKTLVGGPHPTAVPLETVAEDCIDMVIDGEGEITVSEVVNCLLNSPDQLDQVPGVYLKKNGKPTFTGPREPILDLDSLALPARELINMGSYRHPLSRSRHIASILTSRGCPFNCAFCSRGVFGNKLRKRSVESVIEEMQLLIDKYGIEEFHFIDDAFTMDRSRVENICQEIINRGWKIKWATPNGVSVNTVDYDLIKLMKKSGCYSLSFGVESGNQHTLKYINKNQSLEKIKQGFRICHKLGIETVALIIIGLPNETRADIDNTLRFLKEVKAGVADMHMLIPLPGTPLYKELDAKGYILERDWSKFTFHDLPVYRTDHFSPQEIFNEYKRVYIKYHMRLSYVLLRLTRIRSFRDFMNNFNGFVTLGSQAIEGIFKSGRKEA